MAFLPSTDAGRGPARSRPPWTFPLAWMAAFGLGVIPAALAAGITPGGAAAEPPLPRDPGPVLRVLLQEGPRLELGAGSTALRLVEGGGRLLLEVGPGERLRLSRGPDGLVAELEPAGGGPPRLVTLPAREVRIEPVSSRDGVVWLQQRRFRGRLLVRPQGESLQAINLIPLESYLPSVVGSEMPATWPQAALRAQAVAARTYALAQRRPAAPFDLKATVASQVYRGVEAETPATRRAVLGTRSKVLMHGNGLIDAVFHSSSGGRTENSGDLWNRQLPYLVSVPDFDDQSPVRNWEQRYTPEDLMQAFPETGGAIRIEVLASSASGRIRSVRVSGPRGSLPLTGGQLRQRLGLRSTLVRFAFEPAAAGGPGLPAAPAGGPFPPGDRRGERALLTVLPPAADSPTADSASGMSLVPPPPPVLPLQSQPSSMPAPLPSLVAVGRGFGHGVGMSQWGAYGMALRGKGYEEILRHFYRGAELRSFPAP